MASKYRVTVADQIELSEGRDGLWMDYEVESFEAYDAEAEALRLAEEKDPNRVWEVVESDLVEEVGDYALPF